jgi:hypothetical protein
MIPVWVALGHWATLAGSGQAGWFTVGAMAGLGKEFGFGPKPRGDEKTI